MSIDKEASAYDGMVAVAIRNNRIGQLEKALREAVKLGDFYLEAWVEGGGADPTVHVCGPYWASATSHALIDEMIGMGYEVKVH